MNIDIQQLLFWLVQALGGGICFLLWINIRDQKGSSETTAREIRNEADAVARELRNATEAIAKDVAAFRLHISENYVTQNELGKAIDTFSRGIDGMFKKLDRIEEKLDKKQDKI